MDAPLLNPMAAVGVAPKIETPIPVTVAPRINPMVYIPLPADLSPRERRATFHVVTEK